MNTWIASAHDLAFNLSQPARRGEPICVIVGAGASLSSGAPFTWQVLEKLDQAFGGRLAGADAAERRRAVDRFNESEKRAALEPLFSDVVPYTAYRCLAAMGRQRRVYAINLNWDLAIEDACERQGVPLESVSLEEGEGALRRALAVTGPGVTVIHVHGQ